MPRQQDIEQFKLDLAALSHEAEVLARWGEKPELAPRAAAEIAPSSDEGLPPDFAELLDELPIESDRSPKAAPAADAGLDDLLGSFEAEGRPPRGPAPEEAPGAADLDELEALPEAEEGSEAAFGARAEEVPAEEAPAPEAPVDLESFAPPEGETPEGAMGETVPVPEEDFSFDLASFAEPEGGFEAPAAEGAESFDFEPPIPAEAEAEAGQVGGSPGFEAPAPGGAESFDFEAPAPPADESETMAVEPMGEDSLPEEMKSGGEETAFEEPAAPEAGAFGSADDFSIPDLGPSPAAGREASAPEAAAPPETPAEDAFESFSFEESAGGSDFELPSIGPGQVDLDEEIASLGEEAAAADSFNLDREWGGFDAKAPAAAPPRQAPPRPRPEPKGEGAESYKPISLTESEVDALQDSLLSYPLNLRVAIEDVLANEKGTEAQRSRLVWAMAESATAESAAALAGKVLKRHIEVPKGYQKRTGAALEARKGTLAYAFVKTFLPALRIGFLVMAAAGLLGYLGWRLVYVPLSANALYRAGYERIAEDRYLEAEESFAKATKAKEFVAWYYRYAEAYAAKRQYILAERKYASLVERYPRQVEAILAWARLEREQLKYEEAVKVLKGVPPRNIDESTRGMTGLLSWDYFNKDGLILLGDIYLEWAEEDPEKYGDARKSYATLIERYGEKTVYLERMLLYFIRTDKLEEVLPLKLSLASDLKKTALEASTLAELGGYLLDKDSLEDVRPILLRAVEKDPSAAEPYYQLSRYYRRAGIPAEERKALDSAARAFAAEDAHSARRSAMYIESLIWRGRFLLASEEWLSAELDFSAAASEYERGLELRRLKREARFGEAYAGLAEVAFWQREDLDVALGYYERAAGNGYSTLTTRYRRANILYRTRRYAESLEQFYEAMRGEAGNPYMLFAFGCALYARDDFFAAEAQFRKLAEAMEKALAVIDQPMPQERPSEIEVLRLGLMAQNNLGVAIYRTAARAGDARRRSEAMKALTRSIKLYDTLSQAPYALEEQGTRNLGLSNIDKIIESGRGEALEIFSDIERDPAYPKG